MSLIKCPDCGKMVSSRAATCPNCGCPSEFFQSAEVIHEANDAIQPPKDIPVANNIQANNITFHIAGKDVVCLGGRQADLAKNVGIFYLLREVAEKRLLQIYHNSNGIEDALEKVPECAQFTMNTALDTVMKCLYSVGAAVTEDDFLEKYYFKYKIDYTPYYDEVVEKYGELLQLKEDLDEYRELQKASRSQWVGGGFGVKGAIKGAITASILNAGTDFIRSFGDRAQARKDEKQFQELLENLYEDPITKDLLCGSIKTCIENLCFAYNDELISLGVADKSMFAFDKKRAMTLYESTLKYETDEDKLISNMFQCIKLFPAEREFYGAMIGSIYNHCDLNDKYNFYSYLDYWALGWMFPDDTSPDDPVLPFEENLVKHVRAHIAEDEANKNYYGCWPLVEISHGSEEFKELQVFTRQLKPGHTLLFISDELVITDRYIGLDNGQSWKLDFVNKLMLHKGKIRILYDEEVEGSDKLNTLIDEISLESVTPEDKEIIVTVLNTFFVLADTPEDEWKKLIQKHTFDNASKNLVQEIKTIDDYVSWRQFIYNTTYANGSNPYPLHMSESVMSRFTALEKYRKDSIMIYEVLESAKAFAWVPNNATTQQLIDEFRRTAILHDKRSYGFSMIWYSGDDPASANAPKGEILGKLNADEKALLYVDSSLVGTKGFLITDKNFIFTKDMTRIPLANIRDIKFDKQTLCIQDHQGQYTVTNSFSFGEVIDERALKAIALELCILCIHLTNNAYLSQKVSELVNTEQARADKKKELEKVYEEQAEIELGKNDPELKALIEKATTYDSFNLYLEDLGIDPRNYSIDEFFKALRMLYAYANVHDDSSIGIKDYENWGYDAKQFVMDNKLYLDPRLYDFTPEGLIFVAYCLATARILSHFCIYLAGIWHGEGVLSYRNEYYFNKTKGYIIYSNIIVNLETNKRIKWENIIDFYVEDERNIRIRATDGDTIIEIYPKDTISPWENTRENTEFVVHFLKEVKKRFYPNSNKETINVSSTLQNVTNEASAIQKNDEQLASAAIPTKVLNAVEEAKVQTDNLKAKINEVRKELPYGVFAYSIGKMDGTEGDIMLTKDRVIFGLGHIVIKEFELSKIKRCEYASNFFAIWMKGKLLQNAFASDNCELWGKLINDAMKGKYLQGLYHVKKEGLVLEAADNNKGVNEGTVQNPSPAPNVVNQTPPQKSDTVFCVHCGNKIQRQSKFCCFCGKENKYGRNS